MDSIASIILAAGQGKRMKSSFPKVLHSLAGKPLLGYSLELTKSMGIKKRIVVIGHKADQVKKKMIAITDMGENIIYAHQKSQLGTAHAVRQTKSYLKDFTGIVLILSADVPLLKIETIQEMIRYHRTNNQCCTLLTARLDYPKGYGRIVRNHKTEIVEIVEQGDLTKKEDEINEINTGVYCFNAKELFAALSLVHQDNFQKEYYLTDVVKIFIEKGYSVGSISVSDHKEIIGINTRADLSHVSKILYQRNAFAHMEKGVTVVDPANTYIEDQVQIGQDTVIEPFSIITSGSKIGQHCHIGPYSHIMNTSIGCQTNIYASVVENSQIGNQTMVGPYAHIRPGSIIKDEVKIGNFVEIKKSVIDNQTKVGHLTYLGDAVLGKKVNIGAGTITCNFDGEKKNSTLIEEGSFIGSNNSLVAPVRIGPYSYTAAGSAITLDVPAKSLGIARSRQKNKRDWAEKRQQKDIK